MNQAVSEEALTDKTPADRVLGDLLKKQVQVTTVILELQRLQAQDNFRYASKQARNYLLQSLLVHTDDLKDIARNAHRILKKVKRVKPTEELVDGLLKIEIDPQMTARIKDVEQDD